MSKTILKIAASQMPSVSRTEQEALDAGGVGPEASIYQGKVDWRAIGDIKYPTLTEKEQVFFDNETEELCRLIDAHKTRQSKTLSPEVLDYIKKKKFFGMLIAEEEGGLGFSSFARSRIVQKIASHSEAAGVTVMVPNSLGPGELLHKYGTAEQKDKYLSGLADGTYIPCFALTEPNAGSDATAIQAEGVVEENDKGEVGVRLNFDKRYITLAPIANLVGLAVQLRDPNNLLGKGENVGITCFLMEEDTPGLDLAKRYDPMGVPFMNGGPVGKDVWVTPDQIIGGAEQAGNGWKMLVECLSEGRANSLPTLGIAAALKSGLVAGSYIRARQQFGISLGEMEGTKEKLGEIAGLAYMGDAARNMTLSIIDSGTVPTVPGAILKYHMTENMQVAVKNCMDILAGKAIIDGPSNPIKSTYDSVPIGITVEGANILTRNLLIFGQGSYRLHPHLQDMKSHFDNKKGWSLAGRGFQAFGWDPLIKTGRLAMPFDVMPSQPSGSPLGKYYRKINQLSRVFGSVTATHAPYLGGALKFKENFSAKMGDVLSHLYISSSVLWEFEQRGRPEDEIKIAKWAVEHQLEKARDALFQVLRPSNSPFKNGLNPGSWLRPVELAATVSSMNFGPSDKLTREVADILLYPNAVRDRLMDTIYVPDYKDNPTDPIAQLEHAFKLSCETKGLDSKIRKADKKAGRGNDIPLYERAELALAEGALTQDDHDKLVEAQRARDEVVYVDAYKVSDFPKYDAS